MKTDQSVYDLQHQLVSDAIGWRPADRYYGHADKDLAEHYVNMAERLMKWVEKHL